MKLNFKELKCYSGLSRNEETVEDVRESFANAIYDCGQGIAALELARKIYNSDGEEEYSEKEIKLIRLYSNLGNPRFIEGLQIQMDGYDTTSK